MWPATAWIVVGRSSRRSQNVTGRPEDSPASLPQSSSRPTGNERVVLPVLAHRVEERRGAVAEAPASPFAHGSSTGAGSSTVSSGVETGARRDGRQHRARAVRPPSVEEVVVHLHHDAAAGGERHAHAVGQPVAAPAGCPGRDPRRVVEAARRARLHRRVR